jgi:hypothetical protein
MNVEIGRQNIIILFWKEQGSQFHFWEYMTQKQTFTLDSHQPFSCSVYLFFLAYPHLNQVRKYFSVLLNFLLYR